MLQSIVIAVVLATQHWLVLSDAHLNPFDHRPYPASFSHDSNQLLFESAVNAMRKAEPNPSVVMLGGDFLVHHFSQRSRSAHGKGAAERDALDTMTTQARELDRAFPRAQFAVTFGNNDDPCGDYRSEVDGRYLQVLAATWLPLMERGHRNPSLEQTFTRGGYGVIPVLHGRAQIVALNSVYWSFFYLGSCTAGVHSPGDTEMDWLAKTLAASPPAVKSIVLTHIPPGIDATTSSTVRVVGVPLWHERYRERFEQLLNDRSGTIAWAVAGHTHRSDFRLVGDVPMLLAGALSPIYRNQPTFLLLDVNDDGTLLDIHPYAYNEDDDRWNPEPSFDAFWNVPRFDAAALRQIHERLASDAQLRERWAQRYTSEGERIGTITAATWRIYWCAQTTGGDAFARCSGAKSLSSIAWIAGALGSLVIVGIVGSAIWWRRRKTTS